MPLDAAMEEERRKLRVAIEEKAVQDLKDHMRLEDARNARHDEWHVGREIPVAVIFFLIVQTSTIVWWAASTSADQKAQEKMVATALAAQTGVDRRQDDEVMRSEGRLMLALDKVNAKLDRLIERNGK